MPPELPPLADQADRNRFTQELDHNFSVTAPAGVGKTTSLVSRVVALAETEHTRKEPALKRLAVVTYTRKAADEMRRRSDQALRERNAGPDILANFHQAYFGTIHSFCLELLRQYGPLAGIAPQVEQVGDEETLWWEFLRARDHLLDALPEDARDSFARYGSINHVHELVTSFGPKLPNPPPPGPPPSVNLDAVLDFPAKGRSEKTIGEAHKLAKQWQAANAQDAPCPPPRYDKGGKPFQALWNQAWGPLKEWLGEAYLYLAAAIAREFRAFRLERGQINYNDMIALAVDLLEHPAVGPVIRDEKRIIILDEAQDTDRLQFALLLNIAGADWDPSQPLADAQGPLPGRYCQVGDPQQAIYGNRADLATYREVHETLVEQGSVDALQFTVTMRCDEAIVQAVNQFYPNILRRPHDQGQQAAFVPLIARPNAGPGRVERLVLTDTDCTLPEKPNADQCAEAEARSLAVWLRETGHEGLGEGDWSEVSILAPRNKWLEILANELDRVGLPVQLHSRGESRADDPVWAWTSALVRIMAHPEDAFEVAGVLREVFALSDDAIARWVITRRGDSNTSAHPLSLTSFNHTDHPVAQTLSMLHQLRKEAASLALSDAFRLITGRIELGSRLKSLPEQNSAAVDAQLKRLMANALASEEQGRNLESWSQQLTMMLAGDPEGDDAKPGHIQLLSCHKAKGLQWCVVIAPFIHRSVKSRESSFPRYYPATGATPDAVTVDKPNDQHFSQSKKERDAEEMARLAYVSWTRAQRRLLLVDSEAFQSSGRKAGSWLDHWRVDQNGANAQAWVNLPVFEPLTSCKPPMSPSRDFSDSYSTPTLFTHIKLVGDSERTNTETLTKRILPSSLSDHSASPQPASASHARDEQDWRAEPGYPETSAGLNALGGADYGNWWHHSMETGPWSHPLETWSVHLQEMLKHCPIPDRGKEEEDQLLQTTGFQWLNQENIRVRAEVPLLWPEGAIARESPELDLPPSSPPAFVYDGFIDLLAHDETRDTWRIVDWKTDRIFNDAKTELLDAYGPQLTAYVRALRVMFNRPVKGYLYSTRAAEWIALPD